MKIKIEVISGVESDCICINNYRVAGPKPWGGGKVIKSWNAESDDIAESIRPLTPEMEDKQAKTEVKDCGHIFKVDNCPNCCGVEPPR